MTWEYRGRNHCREQGCHAAHVNGGPGLHKNEALIMLSDREEGWHGGISERRWYLSLVLWGEREAHRGQVREEYGNAIYQHKSCEVVSVGDMRYVGLMAADGPRGRWRPGEGTFYGLRTLNCISPLLGNQERQRWTELESLGSRPSIIDYLQPGVCCWS